MNSILKVLNWLSGTIKEPSTQASILGIMTMVHLNVEPGIIQQAADIIGGISGLLGIVLREKTNG